MMPKTTLIAPAGISGQIHASHSGKNYDIAGDGTVVIDSVDTASLLGAGFQHVPPGPDHREVDPDAPPITSDAVGSQETGASALDPAKREALHRETDLGNGQENHDHGDATPPHGKADEGASTDASRAEAKMEVAQAERSGADTTHRFAQANTGHMGTDKATGADQAEARGENDPKPETDAEREEREERERMPAEGQHA